ncbi:hypothetical protein KY284_000932 [Solanum tuberosum]|nr:hypothetical protein KY284_000932 [Solanum tuberosum]
MPNGSLESWLHPVPGADTSTNEVRILGLVERLSISIDVACALEYLHHLCHNPFVYCDLKLDNIFLDNDMIAYVAYFGLTMFFSESMSKYSSIGYAAPKYNMGSNASAFGDVYSYGILLLEMFTGKRPTDSMFKIGRTLHSFSKTALLDEIIGVACLAESPRERMDIGDVVKELQLIRDILLASHAIHSSISG